MLQQTHRCNQPLLTSPSMLSDRDAALEEVLVYSKQIWFDVFVCMPAVTSIWQAHMTKACFVRQVCGDNTGGKVVLDLETLCS